MIIDYTSFNYSDLQSEVAHASFKTEPNLLLTATNQTITGWVPFEPPVGISESNGIITINKAGKYQVNIERGYTNLDRNPTVPVQITIEVYVNGIKAFDRSGIISAATAPDEPTYIAITSPSVLNLNQGDTIEFRMRAEEGEGNDPDSTRLVVMQISAIRLIGA